MRHLPVEALEVILDKFSAVTEVFSKPQLENFLAFVFSIVLCPFSTINSYAEWLNHWKDQSTLNRFLTEAKWKVKQIFKNYHKIIKKEVKERIAKLIIDDSKIEKTGETIERVGKEFDHCKRRNILCFSVVFSIVKISGFDLPIPFALRQCRKSKNKKRRLSKITIAMQMIKEFCKITRKAAKRIILFDSWYAAEQLIYSIPKGVFWVTRLKLGVIRLFRNDNGCWLPLWKFLRRVKSWDFHRVKINNQYFWVYKTKLEINKLGLVTVVFSKQSHYSRKVQIFISNLDDAQEILENYDERWDIEVFNRTVKQDLGIGSVQIRNYEGNRRYWTLVILSYSIVSFLQQQWKNFCKTIGETIKRLKKLLQKQAANFEISLARAIEIYVERKFAKV